MLTGMQSEDDSGATSRWIVDGHGRVCRGRHRGFDAAASERDDEKGRLN